MRAQLTQKGLSLQCFARDLRLESRSGAGEELCNAVVNVQEICVSVQCIGFIDLTSLKN